MLDVSGPSYPAGTRPSLPPRQARFAVRILPVGYLSLLQNLIRIKICHASKQRILYSTGNC